jgi:tRNA(Ile)-lysidine synthase
LKEFRIHERIESVGTFVLEQVLKTISRYNMLGSRDPAAGAVRVAVAVSGGPDSVCLLHAFAELAPRLGLTLSVAHLNHKLRGAESDEDEAFVAALAEKLGLPFHCEQADLSTIASTSNRNLEQEARRARQAFFVQLRSKGFVDVIATGHTRDDQAETVLFRFLRGSGTAGLAGILPVTKQGIIRPLLDVSRAEILEYLNTRAIAWREDRSNLDFRFARNRIRHKLLPELARDWNPNIAAALAQVADLAFEEELVWGGSIEDRFQKTFISWNGGFDAEVAKLTRLRRASTRRLIRRAIRESKGDLRGIEFSHVEAVLELVGQSSGEGRLSLPGLAAIRSFGWLRLAPAPFTAAPEPRPVAAPDEISWHGGPLLCFEVLQKNGSSPCGTLKAAELDGDRFAGSLVLRGWRPGDRYRPVGEHREWKLAELFERARVPSWRRPFWPMVTVGDKILWAKDFGVAQEFAASESSQSILRIFEVNAERDESFGKVISS